MTRLKSKATKTTVSRALKVFLERNPLSLIEKVDADDNCDWAVKRPWGDATLELVVPKGATEKRRAITLYNKLWLPDRLTAVYHCKTKKLEVIYTAYVLGKIAKSLINRSFDFQYEGGTHKCHFGDSSKDLIALSKYCQPVAAPNYTDHRNLMSLWRYNANQEKQSSLLSALVGTPLSFWIENAPDNSEDLVSLVRNLNFYLKYYDAESPTMLIHPPSFEDAGPEITRYRSGAFPKKIRAKDIDENLLVFWNPPVGADYIIKFLHYYKIIEYCAHMYLEDSVSADIKRAISKPDAADDIDKLMRSVLMKLNVKTLDIHNKSKKLLAECVDCKLVWSEIEKNKDFFSEAQSFDGSYKLKKALISKSCTEANFSQNKLEQFYYLAKEIRNALSHGQDAETQGIILPTKKNEQLLKPWVNLLEIISGEVILNR